MRVKGAQEHSGHTHNKRTQTQQQQNTDTRRRTHMRGRARAPHTHTLTPHTHTRFTPIRYLASGVIKSVAAQNPEAWPIPINDQMLGAEMVLWETQRGPQDKVGYAHLSCL